MVLPHDLGIQDPAGGAQGIHRWIDAHFGNLTGQHRCGVQMGEDGGGGRVGQIVRGDVDGLNRGDGALLGGGDPLLKLSQFGGQSGLICLLYTSIGDNSLRPAPVHPAALPQSREPVPRPGKDIPVKPLPRGKTAALTFRPKIELKPALLGAQVAQLLPAIRAAHLAAQNVFAQLNGCLLYTSRCV